MTMTLNTFASSSAIGNREDLTDVIYRISPTATPFMTAIAKGKAANTLHEWQTQDLAAASAANAVAEGADATTKSVTATVRLKNYTQISTKSVSVSGTQQAMNPAGRKDELAYQMSLMSLELRRDMESSLCQNSIGASTTRKLKGLPNWCVDNYSKASDTTLASYTAGTGAIGTDRTKGTTRAFTETQVKSVLQSCFTAGGEPNMILLPPAAKQTFSTFSGNATRFDKSEDAKLFAAVDVYVSDFGEITAYPDRFMDTSDVFLIQSDKWAVSYLRPFATFDLATTGDAIQKQIVVEYTLEARAPKANGAIYDIA